MPLRLLEIEGSNYFSIYSLDVNRKLRSIISETQRELSDERLEQLREDLGECIGYRTAQKLTTIDEMREVAQEERSRLVRNKLFLGRFLSEAARIAKEKVDEEDPNFTRREIRKNAIYHTLTRSGILVLPKVLGQDIDDEQATNDIFQHRKDLRDYLPDGFSEDMVDLLTESMVDDLRRKEFLYELRNRFRLTEDQVRKVEDTLYFSKLGPLEDLLTEIEKFVGNVERFKPLIHKLFLDRENFDTRRKYLCDRLQLDPRTLQLLEAELKKRYRGIGDSQPFRIGRALRDLYRGNRNVDDVLSRYMLTSQHLIPLSKLLFEVGFTRMDIQHFHLPIARYSHHIKSNWGIGNGSMPQRILLFLSELTGEDPSDSIIRWTFFGGISTHIIHPSTNYSDEVLGKLFGHFVLSQDPPYYSLYRRSEEETTDLIEGIGKLPKKLGVFEIPDIGYRGVKLPDQLLNILQTIENRSEIYLSREFALEAFKALVDERVLKDRPHMITIPTSYDALVKQLAEVLRLNIEYSSIQRKRRDVIIRNPEVFGIRGPTIKYLTTDQKRKIDECIEYNTVAETAQKANTTPEDVMKYLRRSKHIPAGLQGRYSYMFFDVRAFARSSPERLEDLNRHSIKQYTAIKLYLGLENGKHYTIKEIATTIGTTHQNVSELINRGLLYLGISY